MCVFVFAGTQNRCLVLNPEDTGDNIFSLAKSLEEFANATPD